MRIVLEVPHPQFKITIFSWNAKYLIKIELSNYEQVFKISEQDVTGLEDVKKILNDQFLDKVLHNFVAMRSAFTQSYQTI